MTDLSTSYLGLSLSNPLVVSASPLSQDVAQIEKMANMGAGAVILQSLFEEQLTAKHEGRSPATAPEPEGAPVAAPPLPTLTNYNFGPKGYLAKGILRTHPAGQGGGHHPNHCQPQRDLARELGQLRSGD
jgi:hypothetical protein